MCETPGLRAGGKLNRTTIRQVVTAGSEVGKSGAPLLKWPGGKRALADAILEHFPANFQTYYEPFFGGGAVFFSLAPSRAVVADLNEDLINCYRVVREDPEGLISVLRTFKNSEDDYYEIRKYRPRTEVRKAARLLYLTRLSFNGIHRVNLQGEFNVPYGKKLHLASHDEQAIRRTSIALKHAQLVSGDFQKVTEDAWAGDLVYFDPPYTVAHANNGFVKYNERIFSWADQIRLALHAKTLSKRGCTVVVSNADHPSIRELYSGVPTFDIERHSVISAAREHRRLIKECIFVLGGENAVA